MNLNNQQQLKWDFMVKKLNVYNYIPAKISFISLMSPLRKVFSIFEL